MTGAEAGPVAGAQATDDAPVLVDVRDVTRTRSLMRSSSVISWGNWTRPARSSTAYSTA